MTKYLLGLIDVRIYVYIHVYTYSFCDGNILFALNHTKIGVQKPKKQNSMPLNSLVWGVMLFQGSAYSIRAVGAV